MEKLMYVVGVRVLCEVGGMPGIAPTVASLDAFLAPIDACLVPLLYTEMRGRAYGNTRTYKSTIRKPNLACIVVPDQVEPDYVILRG